MCGDKIMDTLFCLSGLLDTRPSISLYSKGKKLLLMGSSKYKAEKLPPKIVERLDTAMEKEVAFFAASSRTTTWTTFFQALNSTAE